MKPLDKFIRFTLCLALAIAMTFATPQDEVGAIPRGSISVDVVGPLGEPLTDVRVQLLRENRKPIAKDANGLTFDNLPYDRYIVRVMSPGTRVTERHVLLDTPKLWVRMGLPFHHGDELWVGGSLTVTGTVTPLPKDWDAWWVRVAGVFLNDTRECRLNRSGNFEVSGIEMGTYIVHVFESSQLRYVRQIEIDSNQPVTHLEVGLTTNQPGLLK